VKHYTERPALFTTRGVWFRVCSLYRCKHTSTPSDAVSTGNTQHFDKFTTRCARNSQQIEPVEIEQ